MTNPMKSVLRKMSALLCSLSMVLSSVTRSSSSSSSMSVAYIKGSERTTVRNTMTRLDCVRKIQRLKIMAMLANKMPRKKIQMGCFFALHGSTIDSSTI